MEKSVCALTIALCVWHVHNLTTKTKWTEFFFGWSSEFHHHNMFAFFSLWYPIAFKPITCQLNFIPLRFNVFPQLLYTSNADKLFTLCAGHISYIKLSNDNTFSFFFPVLVTAFEGPLSMTDWLAACPKGVMRTRCTTTYWESTDPLFMPMTVTDDPVKEF